MGLPDITKVLTNFASKVEEYGSQYWLYAIIGTVVLIGWLLWMLLS